MDAFDAKHYLKLKHFDSWSSEGSSLTLRYSFHHVQIDLLQDSFFRLAIFPEKIGLQKNGVGFAVLAQDFSSPVYTIEDQEQALLIHSEHYSLEIQKSPFSLSARRSDGSLIWQGSQEGAYSYLNDDFMIHRQCYGPDMILGLGEKTGSMNRMGQDYTLWNTDILSPQIDRDHDSEEVHQKNEARSNPMSDQFDPYYMSIPFFQHLDSKTGQASGSFLDNPTKSYFRFQDSKNDGRIEYRFTGGQYCEYIFCGPELKDIISDYSSLTGKAALPALWTLGYHQCRWKKYTQDEVLALGQQHRDLGIPCDSLWLDIDYMDGYRVFTWNDQLFPNREVFFAKMKEMNLRTIPIVDPGLKYEKGYQAFDQAYEKDLLCTTENGQVYIGQVWPGDTAFPDFAQEGTRQWWGDKNADLVKQGMAGIWNDMNEPATGEVSAMAMHGDKGRLSHNLFHNDYALLMAKSTFEGLKKADNQSRPFVLSRAGSAGIQRYAFNWMGDSTASWEHLRMSLPMSMGLNLSGQPLVGGDIGGFFKATTAELFVRWMQSSLLSAFFRNHNDDEYDQYAWSFGPAYTKIIKKMIQWRYRLLPYIYTTMQKTAEQGLAFQRPLLHDYQDDSACRDIEDQYLCGESLLVAPILEKGQSSRRVYLPKGQWYRWGSDQIVEGEAFYDLDASLAELPLFVKAGSIIPCLANDIDSTEDYLVTPIELKIFVPKEDAVYKSNLYEDDTLSQAHTEGDCCRSLWQLEKKGKKLSLRLIEDGDVDAEWKRKEFKVRFYGESKLLDMMIQREEKAWDFEII